MARKYEITYQQAMTALIADPKTAAKYFVDWADAQKDLGRFEPIGDMAKNSIAEVVEGFLLNLHGPLREGKLTLEE